MTKEELIGYLQNTIGRARSDLAVAAMAIKGSQIELSGDVDFMRLFAAAELIDKTQSELSALATKLSKLREPLVPGGGSR